MDRFRILAQLVEVIGRSDFLFQREGHLGLAGGGIDCALVFGRDDEHPTRVDSGCLLQVGADCFSASAGHYLKDSAWDLDSLEKA